MWYVDVATVGYNQDILIAVNRADEKTTCKVSGGGGPFVLVNGDGTAPGERQRVNRRRGGGGGGVRYRGGYTGGKGGGDKLRQVEGEVRRVEATH
jgi:hypothetical protein